jgi:hypothetical protein
LHVFRVEVIGPDGKPVEPLAQNVVAQNGRTRTRIPLALNDPPGNYTVKVRDVATGVTGQADFSLSP